MECRTRCIATLPQPARLLSRTNQLLAPVQCRISPKARPIPPPLPAAPQEQTLVESLESEIEVDGRQRAKVLIVGAGITGLVTALGLLKQGFDVLIFERDLTAIRGEGKYRGPIQIQSNALAALEAIDVEMAEEVFEQGVVTGDRINGLCDGLTGEWYVKFDTFTPAAVNGLPVTRVINRVTLQEILARHVKKWSDRGEGVICEDCHVVGYEDREAAGKVAVVLANGEKYEGDLLIGADGIWSKIRTQLFGPASPMYSQYTCYTGISDFVPPDIDTVGYRVFLGNGKYFVSSDVGNGKMQWYGFHKEPEDPEGRRKKRLLEIFGTWCDAVVDLIQATPEADILRRDIYDKPPMFQWSKGRVVIMGDAAHAMQPNLGQGGCMAIEDAFQLCLEFSDLGEGQEKTDYVERIRCAVRRRAIRAAAIHWLAAMAAISASTYKTYLGEGLGPLSFITRYKIPHFGKMAGQVILKFFMPFVLGWVLGGNARSLKRGSYAPQCRLGDRPHAYDLSEFRSFVHDDTKLERAALADWMLLPHRPSLFGSSPWGEGMQINQQGIVVGSSANADVRLRDVKVAERHAKLYKMPGASEAPQGSYHIVGFAPGKTFVNGQPLLNGQRRELRAGDILHFGKEKNPETEFKIKLRHCSARDQQIKLAEEERDLVFNA